jgi:hypothetical protein
MARVVRHERRQRGVFGWIFLILFWAFNAYMLYALSAGISAVNHTASPADEFSQAGRTIGIGLGVGFLLTVWVAGAVILGLFVLFSRGSTVIIEETAGGTPMPANLDTSRWSQRDREAYDASRGREPPMRQIEARARPVEPPREPPPDARDIANRFQPAIVALKVLSEAGPAGFNNEAVDAVLTYLETESRADFSRREAAQLADAMGDLPSDDTSIRDAVRALRSVVANPPAFLAAMTSIVGDTPTDLQSRWLTALRRQVET